MKKFLSIILATTLTCSLLVGCGQTNKEIKNESTSNVEIENSTSKTETNTKIDFKGTTIKLSNEEILVNEKVCTNDSSKDVYIANDVVYYEEGHDFTYGEGEKKDEHTKEEANKHIVVHITKPGDYMLKGTLDFGQISIDLGEDADKNPNAIVNLYLNGVNITNTVAPSIIFYNVYEPFNDVTTETATKDVDTSKAGANVYIVDESINNINGSYVARIYKEGTIVLSEDGKSVEDAKKLHKYDAAFYSKTTMNIYGGENNSGILNIKAENEGLDSEMHLTINGGTINIESGNDGINTNEDGISVTTLNGGNLNILVNGSTGEGDGIDSNGWLVINGGTLTSEACSFSGDAGIDSDMGIHINGGTIIASGNMLDRISESNQTFVVLNFNKFLGEGTYTLKDSNEKVVIEEKITNNFTYLIISNDNLVEGNYTLWFNDSKLVGSSSQNNGIMGGMRPNTGMNEMPENMTPPEGFEEEQMPQIPNSMTRPENEGEIPIDMENFDPSMRPNMEGKTPPEGFNKENMNIIENEDGTITLPDGTIINPSEFKNKEHGNKNPNGGFNNIQNENIELSETFTIKDGENYFSFITLKEN